MLPATKTHRFSLADVLPSCLASLSGETNALGLPRVDKAVVVLVDGLGAAALKARSGHSRVLAPMLSAASTIGSRFPTTTASALATLTTGHQPGIHGLVGYSVLDAAHDRVVNQLTGWGPELDPATWQRLPTLFEVAARDGIRSFAIGPERYRSSGFTEAVLRGAEYLAGASISDRFDQARHAFDSVESGIVYLYVPELDQVGHSKGWQSAEWTAALEQLDAAVASFASTLGKNEGMVLTADHGVLDVPSSSHLLFDAEPGLIDGIRFVAGEPRAIQLHFEPDASETHRTALVERWQASEGGRAWVTTRADAVASGWFGPTVDPEVLPRIGDVIVAARKAVAYYDSREGSTGSQNMIGQHGSWSPEETEIPLLRFGGYGFGWYGRG